MKLLAKSILLAGLIAFSSCSKDDGGDDEQNKTENPGGGDNGGDGSSGSASDSFKDNIIGSWRFTQYDRLDGVATVSIENSTFTSIGSGFAGDIEFKDDFTTQSEFSYNYTYTASVNGGTPTTNQGHSPTMENTHTGNYEVLSETELETSAIDGVNHVYEVTNLTESTMTLKTDVVEYNGPSNNASYKLEVTLKKK